MFISMLSLGSTLLKWTFKRPNISSNKCVGKQIIKRPNAINVFVITYPHMPEASLFA